MFDVLIENWKPVLVSILSPVGLIYIILLLLSDKYDRLLFSPRKKLYYSLTRLLSLSFLGTTMAFLLTSFLTTLIKGKAFEFTIPYLIIVFIIYFICMIPVISVSESKIKTYYWVYIEKFQYEPLFVHKVTFDNKLLMSSTPALGNKNKDGYIIYEDVSFLDNQKIFFLGPQSIGRWIVSRPTQTELNAALEKYKPIAEKVK